MEQLNGIIRYDPENKIIIGFKDVKMMSFGYAGISQRPLFPGVLMVEAAAQLCTYYFNSLQSDKFLVSAVLKKLSFEVK